MTKWTIITIGAAAMAACLSSCTLTPEQAAKIDLLHKIYGMTVQIEGTK